MDLFKLIGSIFIKTDDAEKEIDSVSQHAKDMSSSVGKSMESAGKTISNIGMKLAPLSALTGAILGASVKGASDFNDGMAKMSTLFDTTQTSVSDLAQQFLDLSNQTGISATELAEAGYQALSAGQSVDQVADFVATAGKLSKAGFTDTTTAVDVLTTAMNAYGEEAGTAEEISNKLVRTQNLGKTTVDELASSMGKIIPTASAMNVNIDNLTSGYVSLTKQGIATAEATTYMNSMLNELGDSGTDIGGILQEKTGKSFQDLMAEGYSLADVLQITKDYADENGIAYNELWGSMEAGKAGLAILNGGVDEFNSTVTTMADKTDDVGSALEKLNTPSAKVNRSLNRVKNSGIQLGTSLLVALAPVIDKIATGIEKVTTWFNSLDPSVQTAIGTVLALVTALAPVLIIGGKIIAGVGAVIGVIAPMISMIVGVISSIQSLSGLMVVLGAIITGPVGIVVAIGAIIGAGVYLITHWDQVKAKAIALKDKVVEVWNNIKAKTTKIWNNIKQFFVKAWENIKKTVTNAITNVKNTVTNKFNDIKTTVTNKLNDIKTKFTDKWNDIKTTVTNKINDVKSKISEGLQSAKDTVTTKLNDIKQKFTDKMDDAKEVVRKAIDKIKGFFDFSWSLPKLKLPHFKITGKLSLFPPSIPKISIDWYKKAMEEPYVMTKPTVFGMNGSRLMAGGEAGNEMVYGHQQLMNDIRTASGRDELLDAFESWMGRFMRMFSTYFPKFESMQMVTDTGALVGEITPMIDRKLGKTITQKGRGN